MGSNLVIVALPADDDRAWKISSEKKPHMTLLFLGDAESNPNVQRIMEFVQHAVDVTEHGPFYLEVDHRDVLGEDQADVLHFRKDWSFKWINQFRNQLLQNTDIKTAYESTTQFPEWQPHLTLGYPETPAHEDQIPEYGFNMVRFDRIAVWTGDFDGPDFRLEWPERMADEGSDVAAWSALGVDIELERVAAGRYILQHHGVKGMKWGVRRDRQGRDRFSPEGHSLEGDVARLMLFPSPTNLPAAWRLGVRYGEHANAVAAKKAGEKGDKQWQAGLKSAKKGVEVHNKAADDINKQLSAFNSDKRWKDADGKDIDLNSNTAKMNEYNRAFEKEIMNPAYANAAIAVHGSTSPSGRYKFEIKDPSTGLLKVTDTTKIEHAATPDFDVELTLDIHRDANGGITGFDIGKSKSVAHGEGFVLEHFGVKGMKWGVRKEDIASGAKSAGRVAGAVGKAAAKGADNTIFELAKHEDYVRNDIINGAHEKLRADLPAIKAQHPVGGKLGNRLKKPLSPEARAYRKDVKSAYLKHLEASANEKTNISGSRRYTLKEFGQPNTSKYYWEVSTERNPAKHAAVAGTVKVRPVFDDDGYIVDIETIEEDLVQTAVHGQAFVDSLVHYGVKGMKWGQRRAAPSPVTPSAFSRVPHGDKRKTKIKVEGGQNHPAHEDAIKVAEARAKLAKSGTAALSNKELREVANRVQLEQQVKQLVQPAGKKFVTNLLKTQGNQGANAFLNKKVTRRFVPA